uniref:Retrovirus-related Pol polyprotein from transposon 17.6 n=1 Tax=Cajanus cajan TaxID=3821 RepID=A0A151SII3_CAJCA|nr:Retrovirus-related Pol polyprotein from transposon 17.6 [Cajanus cajan]
MHPYDEEKTSFITEVANFCYKVMSFGLKNAEVTYQRLMDKVFEKQMGRNIEIYVDDMVVKSNSMTEHITDLGEIFAELCKHNMRLNPEKCIEAIPLKEVEQKDVIDFVEDHIITRFGIPQTITTDQGTAFTGQKVAQYVESQGIKLVILTPYYAQANGQVEAANKVVIGLIKKTLRPDTSDILGSFLVAKGQCKFLIVALDLFTKWIEAEPLANISVHQVQRKNIITRFGIPSNLVTDNGLQFTDQKLNKFLTGLGIQHKVTSVEHPQTNGQAESANKVILTELKK